MTGQQSEGTSEPEQPRSGLRNPAASVRGVGAAALAAQGVVLLLAVVPLRVLHAGGNAGTALVLVLAVLSLALAGLMRHRWAWWIGGLLPVVLIVSGWFVHGSLAVLGVIFGLVWLYVLRVRRIVLGRG